MLVRPLVVVIVVLPENLLPLLIALNFAFPLGQILAVRVDRGMVVLLVVLPDIFDYLVGPLRWVRCSGRLRLVAELMGLHVESCLLNILLLLWSTPE